MLTKAKEWRETREAARRQSMATARMLLGIRGVRRGEPYGEIIHCRMRQPVTYNNIRELVLGIDGIGKMLHVPDGTGGSSRDGPPGDREEILSIEEILCEEFPREPRLPVEDEVLSLELLGRQRGGLQGSLNGRLTGGENRYFRSVRELIMALREICEMKTQEKQPREYEEQV